RFGCGRVKTSAHLPDGESGKESGRETPRGIKRSMKNLFIRWAFRAIAIVIIILSWYVALWFADHNYHHGNEPCPYVGLVTGLLTTTAAGCFLFLETFKE